MSLTFGSYQWVPGVGGPTYTATGLAIGAADPDRWVIAAVFSNFQWDGTVASVTIGGVSGTRLFGAPVLTGGGGHWEFWKANIPTGTTANVVVTTGDAAFWDGAAATYYCIGEPTYFDGKHDGTYTGNTFSVAINVPANGAVIAIASNDGAGTLSGWVGVAADSTDNTEQVYYASADELAAETGRTVSFTTTAASSSTDFYGMAVLSVSVPSGAADQSLVPTRYANADTFGAATVLPGAVTLTPGLYVDADTFGDAAVSLGGATQDLTAAIYSDGDTFGSATVTTGAVTISATAYTDPDTFGAAVVTTGPATLSATVYSEADSFGAAVISNIGGSAQNLTATLFADIDSFGAAAVTGGEPVAPSESPGGGGTVAKAPDPIRPNRRAQVRDALEDHLDKAQRVDEPVIEAPKPVKKSKRVAPIAPIVTTDATLGIIREIEARVQAAIDAEATAQALAQAEALAMELAWIAEDEADLELLLLSM